MTDPIRHHNCVFRSGRFHLLGSTHFVTFGPSYAELQHPFLFLQSRNQSIYAAYASLVSTNIPRSYVAQPSVVLPALPLQFIPRTGNC